MIGKRIRYYRKQKSLTQEQLSDGICSVSYLSKIENGDKTSDETAILLCRRLGISYHEEDDTEESAEVEEALDAWYQRLLIADPTVHDEMNILSEKMKKIENPQLLIKYDLYKARYFMLTRDLNKVYSTLKSVKKNQEFFDKKLEFMFNIVNGNYCIGVNQFDSAEKYFINAEILLTEVKHSTMEEGELYYLIALNYSYFFFVTQSIIYSLKALQIFEKEYNIRRMADCQTILGICNRRIKSYKQAESHYKQALKFINLLQDKERTAIIYQNLGFTKASQNDSKSAIEYYKKSLQYNKSMELKNRALVYYLIASEYLKIENKKESMNYLKEGMKLSTVTRNPAQFHYLKLLEFELNDNIGKEYEKYLKDIALPHFEDTFQWDDVFKLREKLGNYYFSNNSYKLASQYYQKAIEAKSKYI